MQAKIYVKDKIKINVYFDNGTMRTPKCWFLWFLFAHIAKMLMVIYRHLISSGVTAFQICSKSHVLSSFQQVCPSQDNKKAV